MELKKRPVFWLMLVCLAGAPLFAQAIEPIPAPEGVPPGSDYMYRQHYEQVQQIMQLPLGQREKALESYYNKLHPEAKIRQYMPNFFGQIVKDYKAAGQNAQADALSEKILEMFPHLRPTPEQELQAAFAQKNYDEAIRKGEQLYGSKPAGQTAAIVAESYIAKQDAAKAAEWSQKALDKLGPKEGARYAAWLYQHYRGKNDIPRALTYYDRLARAHPNSPPEGWSASAWNKTQAEAELLRAATSYSQGNYRQAIDQFYKALEYGPNEQAYTYIGLSHWKLKELDDAMGAFAVATVMNKPGSGKAREYLEQIYSARNGGSLEGIEEVLDQAREALKNQ